VLVIPGAAGHAGQTRPRGLSMFLDWLHLAAGSLWVGGLIGLLVIWASLGSESRAAGLSVCVPRFSNIALPSVLALLATGTAATIIHMPTAGALWETAYGKAILVKVGLLTAAICLASVSRLRAKPRIVAGRGDPEIGASGARLLRRTVSGEAFLVAAAVFAAAVLSSLAPPPPAFAEQNGALASVGPGQVAKTINRLGYRLQFLVAPNKAAAPDSFALRITKNGQPVRGADVTLTFNHTEMEMPQQEYQLTETGLGVYSRAAPALVMVGKWALDFQVTPKSGPPFSALILDQADG
jgi:copper transport protein